MSSIVHGVEPRIISPFQKPHSIIPRELAKPQQLPKRGRMTIAIGMLCEGGMILAADSQATNKDGTTYDRVKVKSETTPTSAFVIAYSCEDLYAAEMLVSEILADLKLTAPRSLDGAEDIVKARMVQWAAAFGSKDERPYMAFIFAAHVEGSPASKDNLALYFCEPPGIMLRQTAENSNGYIAVGAGLVVTDPISRTLFRSVVPPRVCLFLASADVRFSKQVKCPV
jgi:20S proteasome alpha/beta subunit